MSRSSTQEKMLDSTTAVGADAMLSTIMMETALRKSCLISGPHCGQPMSNPDWNFSAPHGAGRLMSRSAAKEAFTVDEFREQMAGIYTTSVGRSTLDECPMAYKGMEDIVGNIGPTVTINAIIKPVYNFKAGDEE